MNNKVKYILKILLGVLMLCLFKGLFLNSIQQISWLKNSSIEDRTRYFLQEKFNDDWKDISPNLAFDFNVESGRNKLMSEHFEISAQVENRKDDLHTFNSKKKSEFSKLIIFDIKVNKNVKASTKLEKSQTIYVNQLPLKENKEIYTLQFSNDMYQPDRKMEQALGMQSSDAVDSVTSSQAKYQILLEQITTKELSNKKLTKNMILLLSVFVLGAYVYLIIIKPVINNKK
ncbi:hypothetical protein HCB28_00240 [Listeria sp. FSL L7-0253]|uniref:hypothetical protein n=1 Tax=Listeria cossartiae TaxID=2838249 RepID=UPI0016289EF7|nr:hypothetical protein [Listeria cossartiae]MBC2184600.1 hypothetical protein [Listeria cossartiae subsp. cossartiae]